MRHHQRSLTSVDLGNVTMSMQIMDVASQHLCKNAEIREWRVSICCRTRISLNMTLKISLQVNAQLFLTSKLIPEKCLDEKMRDEIIRVRKKCGTKNSVTKKCIDGKMQRKNVRRKNAGRKTVMEPWRR